MNSKASAFDQVDKALNISAIKMVIRLIGRIFSELFFEIKLNKK